MGARNVVKIRRPRASAALSQEIGKSPLELLVWLVAFAQRELPTSTRALRQLSDEILAFLFLLGVRYPLERGAHDLEYKSFRTIQDEIRPALRRMANRDLATLRPWWMWNDSAIDWVLNEGSHLMKDRDSARYGRFFLNAGRLLAPRVERIMGCAREGCERIFVRRKGGLYCGQKCLDAVRNYKTKVRLASLPPSTAPSRPAQGGGSTSRPRRAARDRKSGDRKPR